MEHKDLQDHVVVPIPLPEPVAPNGNPSGHDVEAYLLGIPSALPPTWCRKCQVEVQPEGKGKCPRCGAFLKLNFVTRKHPVNVSRRNQLLAQLVREYQPETMAVRTTCQHLAACWERLETITPGSPEWQRLTAASQALSQSLRDQRVEAPRVGEDLSALSPSELAERASYVAEQFLALAIAEAQGRAFLRAAATKHREQGQAATIEQHIAAQADAASKGEPAPPVPTWFRAWLDKQAGTPVDDTTPTRGQAWTQAWRDRQRGGTS